MYSSWAWPGVDWFNWVPIAKLRTPHLSILIYIYRGLRALMHPILVQKDYAIKFASLVSMADQSFYAATHLSLLAYADAFAGGGGRSGHAGVAASGARKGRPESQGVSAGAVAAGAENGDAAEAMTADTGGEFRCGGHEMKLWVRTGTLMVAMTRVVAAGVELGMQCLLARSFVIKLH
eukprot:scaffold128475_cov19-Tisochrysis_lutea.AAC.1